MVYPYIDTLMRGNTNIRDIIEAHLRSTMPGLIDIARAQWRGGLDEKTLPYPADYSATDPVQAIDYPFCGSFSTGADGFIRTDVNPSGSISYDAVYEVTMFVATSTAQLGTDSVGLPKWEKDERTSAMRQRDDLMAIMRASILNTPSLGTANGDPRYRARVREESLRESYPEPVKVADTRNPRWVCTGIINVDINMSETTIVPIAGITEETYNRAIKLTVLPAE
jgi:hypothetical protein